MSAGEIRNGFLHFVMQPDKEDALKSTLCPLCGGVKPLFVPCCKRCWDERQDITPLSKFDGEFDDWLFRSRAHHN